MKIAEIFRGVQTYATTADVNGNPRRVIHFTDIPFRARLDDETAIEYFDAWTDYTRKALGGGARRYRGKDFGGGIVFQFWYAEKLIQNALAESAKRGYTQY